jgi:hypothetical protein
MLTLIVLGQDGTRLTGPASEGALADLAADDRQAGDGHGKRRELELLITYDHARSSEIAPRPQSDHAHYAANEDDCQAVKAGLCVLGLRMDLLGGGWRE